ncbi:MAG TPA: DUF349 domain-containing protein [Bacteroidales bacterium]|nr:DUF349 domain-containing protein [Bacteroidales bacterium]
MIENENPKNELPNEQANLPESQDLNQEITAENAELVEEKHAELTEVEIPAAVIHSKAVETHHSHEEILLVDAEQIDYNEYTKSELIEAMREIIETDAIVSNKNDIEQIKTAFYKLHHNEINEAKTKFVAGGGLEENFVAETDELEPELKQLYKRYKEFKTQQNVHLEEEKDHNLKRKHQIINNIKALTESTESLNDTFKEFHELQKAWHESGMVTQAEANNVYKLYHYAVEQFYDYIKINKELRDLDLRKNLQAKIELCERAEELLLEPAVVTAFKKLQDLHLAWRDIGPVPTEQKEEIWHRFREVTSNINKKHQEYYQELKKSQLTNLQAKVALCEKAEEMISVEITTHKEWDDKSHQLVELQQLWKTIGFAPKKDNNKIYTRFRTACDTFFSNKKEFYSRTKGELDNNLALKTELCLQAESMIDSTDWKKTTDSYIALQKKWKSIGALPRKQSDELWKRFRTACDSFFNNKKVHFDEKDKVQDENLALKKALIDRIQAFIATDNSRDNLEVLKTFQKEWTEIGFVPLKVKEVIQNQYREAINKHFERLNLDRDNRNEVQFRNRINEFAGDRRKTDKLETERDKLIFKIDKLKADIDLWENNIGFFANSKNAQAMIEDVRRKIDDAKSKLETLVSHVKIIDSAAASE